MRRLSALLLSATIPAIAAAKPDAQTVAASANRAGLQILAREVAASGSDANVALSPLSIALAVAMAHQGAEGSTRAEIEKAFGWSGDRKAVAEAHHELTDALARTDGAWTLRIANRLWGCRSQSFLPAYTERLDAQFGAPLERVDFAGDPAGSRRTINAWISDQTESRIPELIGENDINPMTRVVLTNAVYFLGKWESPFAKSATTSLPFHASKGTREVPFLRKTATLPFAESSAWEAVELAYQGQRLGFLLILPKQGQTLAETITALGDDGVESVAKSLSPTRVALSMPKVEFRHATDLAGRLEDLGIRTAFGAGADFSGMTGKQDLFLSKALHEAYLRVDEEGTEAAAATALIAQRKMAPLEPPREFLADRPFLFAIRDRDSGALVFVGAIQSPAGE